MVRRVRSRREALLALEDLVHVALGVDDAVQELARLGIAGDLDRRRETRHGCRGGRCRLGLGHGPGAGPTAPVRVPLGLPLPLPVPLPPGLPLPPPLALPLPPAAPAALRWRTL